VLAASGVSAATAPAFVQPALKAAAAHPRPGSGAGSVGVKVFVSTAGTPGAVTINFTTNPADNAAALDFARRSTYLPALRDGRPFASVGVFLVQFSAAGSPVFLKLAASNAARTAAYEALSAKRYTRAETGLLAYLKTVLAAQADAGGSGWAAVRAEADKALALDAGDAMMAYLAGYALMETDDPVTARTYFRRAQDALKNGATAEDPSLAEKIADALKQTGEGN
jgi:hypothetical protein